MPATDLPLLLDAALAAGEIARTAQYGDPEVWTKSDDSPVSAADLAVDEALQKTLLGARPTYAWLSEEADDDPAARLGAEHCFVVDPIDGTRAYLDGQATWALSVAVVEGSRPTAAVIHLPARGLTYAAAAGQGATLNGTPLTASDRADPEGATLLANKSAYADRHWIDGPPDVVRRYRPSMAYRLSCVAEGKADAMLTLKQAWEWDIAAGALIAAEAGALVTDRHGAPLQFNTRLRCSDGVCAANPALHAALLAALV